MAHAADAHDGTASLPPPVLLLLTGAFLAVTILISRAASDDGAPMLAFLTVATGGAGLILSLTAAATGRVGGEPRRVVLYALGAGAFQALPIAMTYLAVAHVGAGFLSIAFAFPLLLTYVLALGLGMERWDPLRGGAVALGLGGGAILTAAKLGGAEAGAGVWIGVACAVPVVISLGNLYRTRFWPDGAPPLMLAGGMLGAAALLTLPVALWRDGAAGFAALLGAPLVGALLTANLLAFTAQFMTYFRLQKAAGPVYLSQIGTVGALIGAPAAVWLFGEALPGGRWGFAAAAALLAAGVALFALAARRAEARA